MKVLHIVRHAEAERHSKKATDFDRTLTKKGIKTVRSAARRWKKAGFTADLMISSPARRALETARLFAKDIKYAVKKIDKQDMLYESADNASLMKLVNGLPDDASDVLIFGHDPAFSDFAQQLTAMVESGMPKCAVITVGFDGESWTGATPANAQLLRFDYPMGKREKARRADTISQDMSSALSAALTKLLKGNDSRTAEKLRNVVMKEHPSKKMRKMAERFVELAPRPHGQKDKKGRNSSS
jgi:phosphohistidine phosphatase